MLSTGKAYLPLLALLLPFGAQAAPFTINVNFIGGLTASQQSVFTTAATTWMNLLPQYASGINITSLNISAEGVVIDGAGGILGQAGPDLITSQGGFTLTTAGSMQFDTADIANMEANGTFDDVILHEMAHVMGFGTLWTLNGVYVDGTGQYTGTNAVNAYRTEYGQPLATFVPVELGGGQGTANGHWSESVFGAELMTGFINGSPFISNTTVRSFVDLGYLTASAGVPEPSTMMLLSGAFGALLIGRRRKS